MLKFVNGKTRPKNAREIYVEQLSYGRGLTGSMNKKRGTFTSLNPSDDTDFAYRSTPNYLRQIAQQDSLSPIEMISARNVPRTKSASEITQRNNLTRSMSGNPKYKAQEDYYDEIQSLKKDMKAIKDENNNLRAKIRRLEEDNARKRKEIDALYDTSKDGDLRRTLSGSTTDRNNNNTSAATNVVLSLKQRLFKLESQLKQKETAFDEIKSDPRWTKSTELEIQNRALIGELERQKVERLNYIQQNDYMGSIDEEKKNAVRKLNREKDDLKTENESLKKKVQELEKSRNSEPLSARLPNDDNNEKELLEKNEDLKKMKRELEKVHDELEKANENLERIKHERKQDREKFEHDDEKVEKIKRERDQFHEKLDQANENIDKIKRERDQFHEKLDQANEDIEKIKRDRDQLKKDLERERDETKLNKLGRSSPAFKGNEKSREEPTSPPLKRPQSPIPEKKTPRSSTTDILRDLNSFDKSAKIDLRRTPSPTLSSKLNNLGSGNIKNQPTSTSTSNEAALKTVQASLRGYLNRNEVDKTPGQIPSTTEKSKRFGIDDDDDSPPTPAKPSSSSRVIEKKRDSVHDQTKSNFNDKSALGSRSSTRDKDSSPKPSRSHSPATDSHPLSSSHIGSGGGSKQNFSHDRNKLAYGDRLSRPDQDSLPKAPRSPSPSHDTHPPSSSHLPSGGGGGGSKQNLSNDQNKLGSGSRLSRQVQDSPSKAPRSHSPSADSHPLSSSRIGSGGGGGGSKQNLTNDRNKLGSDNRLLTRDKDSSPKPQPPSSSSNAGRSTPPPSSSRRSSRPITPEESRPSSKKSPNTSKQSIKDTQKDDVDDDDDVMSS